MKIKKESPSDESPKKTQNIFDKATKKSSNVTQLGFEDDSEAEGCDYVLAAVHRETGAVQYTPTKLVTFERSTVSQGCSIEELCSETKVNYTMNNKLEEGTWAEKRRALTTEFGSAKKTKIQDLAKKRQIKDDTLAIMMNTAINPTNDDEIQDEANISLLKKAESSVLPKANHKAKLPRDVYSLSQFMDESDIINSKSECFDQLNASKQELIKQGYSHLVMDLMGKISEDTKRCCYILLLDAMVRSYKIVSKRRSILHSEWCGLQYPAVILAKIRELFFHGEFSKSNQRIKQSSLAVNAVDKDRLLAHILCLSILLNHESNSVPITPWSKELGIAETRITKFATALGCIVHAATAAEGIKFNSTRLARLAGPPVAQHRKFSRKP